MMVLPPREKRAGEEYCNLTTTTLKNKEHYNPRKGTRAIAAYDRWRILRDFHPPDIPIYHRWCFSVKTEGEVVLDDNRQRTRKFGLLRDIERL